MSTDTYPPFVVTVRELLAAGKRAMLPKRLTLGTGTALVALAAYAAIHYLTAAIHGERLGALWSAYGLFPPYDYGSHIGSVRFLLAVGYFLVGIALIAGMVAISRVRHLDAQSIHDTTLREAVRFSLSRVGGILLVLLGVFGLIALPLFFLLVGGVANRIPVLGEWGWGLLFMIPSAILAFVIAWVVYLVPVAIPTIVPAMLGTQEKRDSFAVLVRIFSSIMRHPVRFFGFSALAFVIGKVSVFIFSYVLFRGTELMMGIVRFTGGMEAHDRLAGALGSVPLDTHLASFLFTLYPGSRISFDPTELIGRSSGEPLETLLGLAWLVVFGSVAGYLISFWSDVALTITASVTPIQSGGGTTPVGSSLVTKPDQPHDAS